MKRATKYKVFARISRKTITLIFSIAFCLFLQSSTTHYSPLLRHYLLKEELASSYQGLWPAAKDGSDDSLDALARLASINNDKYWLEQAASLNSLYAQLALVRLSENEEQVFWWQQAANNGHGPSQFELSLIVASTEERIRYLEQAALNEYIPAIIALSNYYYEENDIENALRWLNKASQYDPANIVRLGKMLWYQGKYEEAQSTFAKASLDDKVAQTYLSTIRNTPIQPLSVLASSSGPLRDECSQQLQFVVSSLDSAVQANAITKQFGKDQRLHDLAICIKPLIWIDNEELTCPLVNHRKVCDLSELASTVFTPSYTHLVFFLDEGKAYVQNGVMYLDEADSYSVFIHELAHFVGFVDEYSVNSSLASQYCYEGTAPNLLVSDDDKFYKHDRFSVWEDYHQALVVEEPQAYNDEDSGSTFTGTTLTISQSRTCSSLDIQSYKPSNKLTFMQYHDTDYIPPIYLLMWQDLLKSHHHSIAVSELFKQQSIINKNDVATSYWSGF